MTANPILTLFICAGLVTLGFSIFRKAKRAARGCCRTQGVWGTPHTSFSLLEVSMTVSAFLTGICSLISGVFSAVFAQPLLAFFMTATLLAVVAGLFLYIYRRSKRF